MKTNATWRQRIGVLAMAILLPLAAIAAIPTAKVSADASASLAGCHKYTDSTAHLGSTGNYQYTNTHTVPTSSGCNDINISYINGSGGPDGNCGYFWVTFFPASGGSTDGAHKYMCSSSTLKVLASDVRNGTKYRINNSNNIYIYTVTVYD